jgi:hypothetical protein
MSGNYFRMLDGGFEGPDRTSRMMLPSGELGEFDLASALSSDYEKHLAGKYNDQSEIFERAVRIAGSIMLAREAVMDGAKSSTIKGDGYTVYCQGIETEDL